MHLFLRLLLLSCPIAFALQESRFEQEVLQDLGIHIAFTDSWIDQLNNKLASLAYPSTYQSHDSNFLFAAYPTLYNKIPYLSLANLPTPVEKLDSLSKELGVNLYIKRDDLT